MTTFSKTKLKAPPKKTFDAEGVLLKAALIDSLRERRAALEQLADAARRVDHSASLPLLRSFSQNAQNKVLTLAKSSQNFNRNSTVLARTQQEFNGRSKKSRP